MLQVAQPPYASELNPVEHFFRELCQALEGRVHPTLQARRDARELILKTWLGLDPEGLDRPVRRPSSSIIMRVRHSTEHGLSSPRYDPLPYTPLVRCRLLASVVVPSMTVPFQCPEPNRNHPGTVHVAPAQDRHNP